LKNSKKGNIDRGKKEREAPREKLNPWTKVGERKHSQMGEGGRE